jgi:hypothetical protein
MDVCTSVDVELWEAGAGRQSACVKVLSPDELDAASLRAAEVGSS